MAPGRHQLGARAQRVRARGRRRHQRAGAHQVVLRRHQRRRASDGRAHPPRPARRRRLGRAAVRAVVAVDARDARRRPSDHAARGRATSPAACGPCSKARCTKRHRGARHRHARAAHRLLAPPGALARRAAQEPLLDVGPRRRAARRAGHARRRHAAPAGGRRRARLRGASHRRLHRAAVGGAGLPVVGAGALRDRSAARLHHRAA